MASIVLSIPDPQLLGHRHHGSANHKNLDPRKVVSVALLASAPSAVPAEDLAMIGSGGRMGASSSDATAMGMLLGKQHASLLPP
jgi:hypothetical protein